MSTFAGTGERGGENGSRLSSSFSIPDGICMDNLDMHINYSTTMTVFHSIRQEAEQVVDEVQTVRDDVRANVHLVWVAVSSNGSW